jgi:recombination protein RecT
LNKQLGYGYILVFNNWDKNLRKAVPTPTFVPGYRGFIQLAMRTGQYKNINADVVFEGELKGKDKLSGAIDLGGEKTSDKVVGYFAHFELLSGFAKTWYMSIEQMATFALTYAPVFKGMKEKPTIDNLIDLANDQIKNGPVQGQTGWKANFNAMAQKTVLRNLLSKYGFLSIEMMNAISMDEKQDYDSAEEIRDTENAEQHQVVDVNKVIEDAEEVTEEQAPI